MAVIKCKMCGGDLVIEPGSTVAECEFCGSKQTIPNQDDDKKLTLFARANRLRMGSEFDKAAGIYESIVADFPEEAEAYWGLVLCKYGIEYVDDPASGKKIPTCHRSSFDSVMEDSDFEQAMENADGAARRVYRDEAKAIEEIRKGIIEVSGKEEPYDIFICYKETAENGDRTIDSVIAQDVYDALTAKGYRVFFSRITLEDKLGQEYEPYIFAALNSAKIMLAFGTDYEYYNAVWVKNEWSRYLKLMAKDKAKHLIPCYKDIGPYDMPGEFAKLQAQDMGKIGAMQDLLRGIEKILPKAAPVIQPVIAHQSAMANRNLGDKLSNLLERGNIALEDGDWRKADSFYEDALNTDPHCAEAYLGKLLATEQCRTIDAFVRKRKDMYPKCKSETLQLQPDHKHIQDVIKRYSIPGYLQEKDIYKLYDFDLHYSSDVRGRKQNKSDEEQFWKNHRVISRVEQYAQGQIADVIRQTKVDLFGALDTAIKIAQKEEADRIKKVQEAYAAHIQNADAKAEQLHEDASGRRENDYQKWLVIAKTENNVQKLEKTANKFESLGTYKDSVNLAKHCRARAEEEQAKLDAEKAAQEKEAARKAAEQKKKRAKLAVITSAAAAILIVAALIITKVIIPNNHYNQAVAMMNDEKYEEAIEIFEALNGYKDSAVQIQAIHYQLGTINLETNEKMAAIYFGKAGNYLDAREKSRELWDTFVEQQTIFAGHEYTAALKSDGTVVAVGKDLVGNLKVSTWKNIIAISEAGIGTYGLKSDGTVLRSGHEPQDGQDFVAICEDAGLKSDGTVINWGNPSHGQDGVKDWENIIAVSTGLAHTVGLKVDGTVVAVGDNTCGQCDVSKWTDIVAISAGFEYTLGLRADGTVVAVGNNEYGQCDVSEWTDIVAVSAGTGHTLGLKKNGTAVAVGTNFHGGCDVSTWYNLVAVSAGWNHSVGLKSDGTVVAVGDNKDGQCNVSGWKNIMLPNVHR